MHSHPFLETEKKKKWVEVNTVFEYVGQLLLATQNCSDFINRSKRSRRFEEMIFAQLCMLDMLNEVKKKNFKRRKVIPTNIFDDNGFFITSNIDDDLY